MIKGLSFLSSIALLCYGWLSGYSFTLTIAIGVIVCRVLKIKELKMLFFVSAFFFVVNDPFTDSIQSRDPGIDFTLSAQHGIPFAPDIFSKYCALVSFLLFSFLVIRFLPKKLSVWSRISVVYGVFFLGLWASIASIASGKNSAIVFGSMFILCFSSSISYLATYIHDQRPLSFKTFASEVFPPFWDPYYVARPKLDIIADPGNQNNLDLRCLRNCAVGICLVLFGKLLNCVLLGDDFFGLSLNILAKPLPDIQTAGLSISYFALYTRFEVLLALVWNRAHIITNYFSVALFFESCYEMLKFSVPKRFYSPLKAKNFGEFFSAIMPYYSTFLSKFFLYPSYAYFRKKNWSKSISYDVALAIAMIGGGLFLHMPRDVHLAYKMGFGIYLQTYLVNGIPYFVLLFLAIKFLKPPRRLGIVFPWPFRFSIFLLTYSLIFISRIDGFYTPAGARIDFLFHLVGVY